MKLSFTKTVLTVTLSFFLQSSTAQRIEINVGAYTGLFRFHGNNAVSSTIMLDDPYFDPPQATVSPYGKRSGWSYAMDAQAQWITRKKHILGLGLGYESLTSKANIGTIIQDGIILNTYSATGDVKLQNKYIVVTPFAGHRFGFMKLKLDLLAGIDLAFCSSSYENGRATADANPGYTVKSSLGRAHPDVDTRLRAQIKTQFKNVGLNLGYSLGLTNYVKAYNDNSTVYSGFLRFGLSYQLK